MRLQPCPYYQPVPFTYAIYRRYTGKRLGICIAGTGQVGLTFKHPSDEFMSSVPQASGS